MPSLETIRPVKKVRLKPGWLARELDTPSIKAVQEVMRRERAIQAVYDEFDGNAHRMATAIYHMRLTDG